MKIIRVTTVPISIAKILEGQLNYMQHNGHEIIAVSSDGIEIPQIIAKERCKHVVVPMTRVISPVADFVALIKMYFLFRKEKPAVVHSHTPKAGIVAMLAAYLARVPVRMHTVAGLPLMERKGLQRNLLNSIEKFTYAFATRVYPNSKNLAAFILTNNFCGESKVKVLGNGSSNGIDTEYFKLTELIAIEAELLREKLQISTSNFIFIFVGRLVKDKGIEELVSAFSFLANKFPHIRLLLLGAQEPELDPLTDKTRQKIETDKRILNVGYKMDIRPYLGLSDVLVFPTYREGFPNVPMQAGCFDLPSIVTNINGCNEIVENEVNGLIIPSKSEDALYVAMERLLTDKNLYSKLKLNARRMIVERYERRVMWNLLLNEYNSELQIGNNVP